MSEIIHNMLPKNDLCFKMIFGNQKHKRLLIHFLNCIVEVASPIKDVKIEKTDLTAEYVSEKWSRLDVLATTQDGEKINIEIQIKDEKNIIPRTLFYWSRIYTQQLPSGVRYEKLKRTISIIISDFQLFDDDRFWRKCHITDDETKERITNIMELHFMELKKMKHISEKKPITVWLEFLRNPYSKDISKYEKTMPELKEAKELYGKINSDPKAKELWRLREKSTYDEFSAISAAEEMGMEKGKTEGELKKAREIAKNLLLSGLIVGQISQATGLSVEEIETLR